jgi:hypothetical protein
MLLVELLYVGVGLQTLNIGSLFYATLNSLSYFYMVRKGSISQESYLSHETSNFSSEPLPHRIYQWHIYLMLSNLMSFFRFSSIVTVTGFHKSAFVNIILNVLAVIYIFFCHNIHVVVLYRFVHGVVTLS